MATVQPTLLGLLPATLALPAKKAAPRKRRPKPVVAATAPVEYATRANAEGHTTWTLRFPMPVAMQTLNTGKHWRTTSAAKKAIREAMHTHARAARLPVGLARVWMSFELRFPTNGRRDADNYRPYVVKPMVDACGPGRTYTVRQGPAKGTTVTELGYGLIPDDTAEFLDGPHVAIGPKVEDPKRCPFGEVVVTITDLSEVAACCPRQS